MNLESSACFSQKKSTLQVTGFIMHLIFVKGMTYLLRSEVI